MNNAMRTPATHPTDYDALLNRVVHLIDEARRTSTRAVNAVMTATYWLIGRRIVEYEQGGKARAVYGAELLKRMAADLTARRGKGYSLTNLKQFRHFYLIPIAERAQAIMEAFDDRQESTRHALAELQRLAREKIEAEEERRRTGMGINTFTIYWVLKGEGIRNAQEVAATVNAVIEHFPNFRFSGEELRQLKAEMYRALLSVVEGKKMVFLAERLLALNRKQRDAKHETARGARTFTFQDRGCPLGRNDQGLPQTDPVAAHDAQMGFLFGRRTCFLQLRSTRAAAPVSRLRDCA